MNWRRLLLLVSLAAALCAARGDPGQVQSLIGDAMCESDSDCATIGVGVNACGAPTAYVAWSRRRTDSAALHAAVQAEAVAQPPASEASGRVSRCEVKADPGAWCDRRASRGFAGSGACRLHGPVTGTRPHVSTPAR